MSEQAVPQALVGKPQHRCSFKHNPDKAFGLVALLFWALLLASAGVMGLENSSPAALRLVELEGEIARDYAGVTHISVATLKSDFADALLVDVRAASEYERSHLPGALHAPTSAHVDALRQRYPERDLVLYCTVGVRSSIAVRDLLAREIASTEGASSGPAGASSGEGSLTWPVQSSPGRIRASRWKMPMARRTMYTPIMPGGAFATSTAIVRYWSLSPCPQQKKPTKASYYPE